MQGWLLPSEIQPLETRSAGQGLTVAVNFLFTFLIGQSFLSMLCAFQVNPFCYSPCQLISKQSTCLICETPSPTARLHLCSEADPIHADWANNKYDACLTCEARSSMSDLYWKACEDPLVHIVKMPALLWMWRSSASSCFSRPGAW